MQPDCTHPGIITCWPGCIRRSRQPGATSLSVWGRGHSPRPSMHPAREARCCGATIGGGARQCNQCGGEVIYPFESAPRPTGAVSTLAFSNVRRGCRPPPGTAARRCGSRRLLSAALDGASVAARQAAPAQAPAASSREASERAAERLKSLKEEADSLLARERSLLTDLRRLEVDRAMAAERLAQNESRNQESRTGTGRHRPSP